MPKKGKTDKEWEVTLKDFAASGKATLKTGQQPGRASKWIEKYRGIKKCPAHNVGNNQLSIPCLFTSSRSNGKANSTINCSCGYHEAYITRKPPPPPPRKQTVPTPKLTKTVPSPTKSPQKVIPGQSLVKAVHKAIIPGQSLMGRASQVVAPPVVASPVPTVTKTRYSTGSKLPGHPEWKGYGVDYLRANPIKWITKESFLDLLIFAPTTGYCPHCTSKNIFAHGASKAKFVYGKVFPYWCLGVNIRCKDCSKMVKSIDVRYVATLPRADRMRMPFLSTGRSNGVDYYLIVQMRLGQSAKGVAQSQNCSSSLLHQSLKAKYEQHASNVVRLQHDRFDGIENFENLPDDWLVKPFTMIKAFICDYLMHRADLCLELQGNTVTLSAAMDHQRKVVKRVRRQSNELEMGQQSFVITGDLGVILNYVVVPDTGTQWTNKALNEVASRFDGQRILFVDCGCCNGRLRNDNPENDFTGKQPWTGKLLKKLTKHSVETFWN